MPIPMIDRRSLLQVAPFGALIDPRPSAGAAFPNVDVQLWGGYFSSAPDTKFPKGAWNFGDGPASDAALTAGIQAAESQIGYKITCMNTFPCYGEQRSWAHNLRRVLLGMKGSPVGNRVVPIHGIALFLANIRPDMFKRQSKAAFDAIAGGAYDSMYADMVRFHAELGLGTAIFRLDYEYNADWRPDGETQNDIIQKAFKMAWENVSGVLHAAGTRHGVKVIVGLNPIVGQFNPTVNTPSMSKVDWIMIDFYNALALNTPAQLADPTWRQKFWEHAGPLGRPTWGMADLLSWLIDLKQTGKLKPLFIAESGSDQDSRVTASNDSAYIPYLSSVIAKVREAGIPYLGQCLWDLQVGDGNHRYTTYPPTDKAPNGFNGQPVVLNLVQQFLSPSKGAGRLVGDTISLPAPVFNPRAQPRARGDRPFSHYG